MTNSEPQPDSSALTPREDVKRPRSRWHVIVPGTRLRLGIGGLVLTALIVAVLLLSVIVFPNWIVTKPKGIDQLTGKDLVTAENALDQTRNAVRGTLVQAIGGALVLLTFAVAFGQLMTARRGQIIDRFTKTVDQIGSEKIDVRLGGIYALQQITTNREYARPIAEIYVAYLKTHALMLDNKSSGSGDDPTASKKESPRRRPSLFARQKFVTSGTIEPKQEGPPPDLQAILRILVLEQLWNEATSDRLDLSRISVSHAELPDAQLDHCILLQASLMYANLKGANLSGSDLREINLTGAQLTSANLGADLWGRDAQRSKFGRRNTR
jgi:Pentapeptide repeats (8 copies)